MRTIKVLAIIGLAVALAAVPALAQQPTVPVTVKCGENDNITIDTNPVRLVIAKKDIARWTFDKSVGDCKVSKNVVTIEVSGTVNQDFTLVIKADGQDLGEVALKKDQKATDVVTAIVGALKDKAQKISDSDTRFLIIADKEISKIQLGEKGQPTLQELKVGGPTITINGITFKATQATLQERGLNKIEIAVEVRDLVKLDPNPVDWKPGAAAAITGTPLKAGSTKYSIKFLRGTTLLHEVKEASVLEIIVATPTLTEWGLIALAVLLAGGMGYMLYRRRPALRPAAP